MEQFKIDHFKRDNPGKEFPTFCSLTPEETKEIRQRLSNQLGYHDALDPEHLTEAVSNKTQKAQNRLATDDNFILSDVVSELSIQPKDKVYINWYRFDDIDEFRFVDLNENFSDIWYPGSDDIEMFDSTFAWILSISHDGYIGIVYSETGTKKA